MVAGLASGVLVGFVNGVLVAKVGIPSFIATLGTQFFWFGMATVLSGGKSYALRGAEETLGVAADRRPPLRRPTRSGWVTRSRSRRCGRR